MAATRCRATCSAGRCRPTSSRRSSATRRCSCSSELLQSGAIHVGAGLPAKQATRYMAPAWPVFAGKPAPTGTSSRLKCASKNGPKGQLSFPPNPDTTRPAT
ncbi:hypothetical protein EI693_22610 [Pseudomonas oryziphila]|uniref:DUF1534 domain-containing protein n=1 Tax=Pseudomonas oryziphila TaxID=2894079 RepID=A0ABN5TMX5_9PSED|nr:hypothetical protein EI693_22610 [Pseudomonas oryziphila]